jgi:hypothetical protein
MLKVLLFLMGLYVPLTVPTFVQETDIPVPDLIGLNVPTAAALLNKSGFRLGLENNQIWTSESGLAQNTINSQSIPSGQSAVPGTTIDVTVLRLPNVILIYDDNDLTLVNRTVGDLSLTELTFIALDGNGASFAASRWAASVRPDQCVQIWSVGRNGAKGLDECSSIQNWLVTTNDAEHFWTGEGGTTKFAVLQNGVQRAICSVSNPGRCEFYVVPSGLGGDSTAYVYFAYTTDQLVIINPSIDQWMVLSGFNLTNNSTGGSNVPVGDPTLYTKIPPDVATVERLAPGQCILFTNHIPASDAAPPQPCEIIARLDLDPGVIFWSSAFGIESADGQSHSCPVATHDSVTICIMPR